MPEDVVNLIPNPHILDLFSQKHGSINRDFTKGYDKKPLSYRESPSIVGSAIQLLPFIGSISRTTTSPSKQLFKPAAHVALSDNSENNRFLGNRENVPSSSRYKYARQTGLQLPVVSSAQLNADSSVAPSEELFRHTSDTISELTYSRNNRMPELALAPIARAAETNESPQTTAPEPVVEESGEQEAAPDIRALAREIYPLIKRMVMVERERRPT
jgi:hypothetical protein